MTYSAIELAASGDAVRALRELLGRRGSNLTVLAFGPGVNAPASLWRLVLGSHRFSVWAHGLSTGTLAVSVQVPAVPGLAEAVRPVVPVTWREGELRASELRPHQAVALIETVQAHLEARDLNAA